MGKRGRGGRGGGKGGPAEDQYGEIGGQDRGGDHHSSGSGRGGGTAGGGSSRGGGGGGNSNESLTYVRQVPKFLQGYAQLLGSNAGGGSGRGGLPADGDELDGATVVREESSAKRRKKFDDNGRDEEEEDEAALDALDRADALAAALRENPELAEEHPELRASAAKSIAEESKQKGNEAIKAGNAEEAVKHYSRALAAVAITGDASSSSSSATAASAAALSEAASVYFSNRSAALSSLKRWDEALSDARAAVKARPRWHKAHVRVGEAARGKGLPGEAAEAFSRALALSPGDEGVAAALFAARAAEARAVAERAHKFVRGGGGGGGGGSLKRKAAGEGGGAEKKEAETGRLSFAADEEEEGEEDEEEED